MNDATMIVRRMLWSLAEMIAFYLVLAVALLTAPLLVYLDWREERKHLKQYGGIKGHEN